MQLPTRALALASLVVFACHGDADPESTSGGDDDTSSTSSAVTRAPLTVPTNTILPDGSGVLSPQGNGSVAVDDAGHAHTHIPIWAPPGRAGVEPNLAIENATGAGNGMLGVGWGLSGLPRIMRCPGMRKNDMIAQPIEWGEGDSFCLDGEPLWADSDHWMYYPVHWDGSRIWHQRGAFTDPGSWEMRTKDGRIVTFGGTVDSKLLVTPQAAMTWAVSRVQDHAGNFMTITYEPSPGGDIRPKRIDYTGSAADSTTKRSVTFTYELTRSDVDQRAVAGTFFTYPDRLKSIEMHAPNSANMDPLRSVAFKYAASGTTGRSLLTNVAECAGAPPASLPVSGSTPLCRQQTFNYAPGVALAAGNSYSVEPYDANGSQIDDVAQTYPSDTLKPSVRLLDVDGDGRDDLLYMSNEAVPTYHLRFSQGNVFGPAIATGILAYTGSTPTTQGPSAPLVLDFNSDGHADILVNQGQTAPNYQPQVKLYLANNAGGSWHLGGSGYEYQLFSPAIYDNAQVADLNGDGRPDILMFANGYAAYYAINRDGNPNDLSAVHPMPLPTTMGYRTALTSFYLDLNNDGVTDLMTSLSSQSECTFGKFGDTCDCKKTGYGVFDIDKWIYPSFSSQPDVSSRVSGLNYCKTVDVLDTSRLEWYDHVFGDFNGDGNADALETLGDVASDGTESPLQLTMFLGGGDQSFTKQSATSPTTIPQHVAFQTFDADGDGKMDLLERGFGATPYTVWSWKNKAWKATPLLLGESPAPAYPFATGDVDGDGLPDFVALDGTGAVRLYRRYTGTAVADFLTSTSGDFTAATTIKYQPYHVAAGEDRSDCAYPLSCVTRAGYVVNEVDTDNGIGGANAQTHTYSGGRADMLRWGFLGFKSHTVTDAPTGEVTTRKFDFTRNTAHETPFYPYVRHPIEVDDAIMNRTTTVTNQYEVQGNGFYSVNPISTNVLTKEGATFIDEQFITRTFDQYGNKTYERDRYPTVLEELDTTTTYYNDFNTWLVGLPTDVITVSSTNVTITGATSQTRETSRAYDANGLLAVETDEPTAQNDNVQTLYTRITRNANGLPTLVEKLDDLTTPTQRRATANDYDASEGMYLVQTTDPMALVTQASYEPGLGVVAATSDAAGVVTTFQYDTFGRIRADHPAAGDGRTVAYHVNRTIDDHRSGQYQTTSTLDSLRRTTQTKTTGRADGKAVYVDTVYDTLGRVASVSRPHFAGVTAAKTVTTYDKLGRVTKIQGADGSVQTSSYTGLSVTTTNPDGNASTVTNDTRARPVASVQTISPGHTTTTTLAYGPFNTLLTSTDTLGNIVQHSYDHLGRERWKKDFDSGATAHTYDVFGQVTDEVRGGRVIPVVFGGHVNWIVTGGTDMRMSYDADGRVTSSATPDITQSFSFDAATGKLTSTSITGGPTIAYTYYAATGQLHTKTWAGPRGAIGYSYTYDTYGRLTTTAYPALPGNKKSLVVRNAYSGADVGGQLTKVDDVTAATAVKLWQLVSTDASEAFPIEQLFYGVQTTRTEDPSHPGWLYTVSGTQGTTIQNLRYTREGGGRVKKREDLVPTTPVTETFTYDGVERLTSWTWTGAAGTRGTKYVYDDVGNLLQRNITAGPGASVTYTPGASSGAFGPHQNASDSVGTAYQYDAAGNQLTAPGRTITWNTFNRPTSVTSALGTYQLTYDAELARFSRTDPAGHTRYSYGGLFDELTDATGTHDVLTIMAGGAPVGELEITNNVTLDAPRSALLTDALGSIDTIYFAGTAQRIKYDPFGARVTATDPTVHITAPPQDLRAGFTGHNHDDDANLIDMVGRVYDPVQQRFLSVDPPAPDPVDGQAYNPYAYVRNNPLNATDPTGYLELHGSSLGLSPNAGLMWDSADTYLGWIYVYVIPYGALPGEVQGPSGQEGPGGGGDASKIGAVDYAGASKVNPVEFAQYKEGGSEGEKRSAGSVYLKMNDGFFGFKLMHDGDNWSVRVKLGFYAPGFEVGVKNEEPDETSAGFDLESELKWGAGPVGFGLAAEMLQGLGERSAELQGILPLTSGGMKVWANGEWKPVGEAKLAGEFGKQEWEAGVETGGGVGLQMTYRSGAFERGWSSVKQTFSDVGRMLYDPRIQEMFPWTQTLTGTDVNRRR